MWHVSSHRDHVDQSFHKQGRGDVEVELVLEVPVDEVVVLELVVVIVCVLLVDDDVVVEDTVIVVVDTVVVVEVGRAKRTLI